MAAAQCACTQELFEQICALFVLAFWLGLLTVLLVICFRDLFWRYFNQPIPFRPDSVFADKTPKVERKLDVHIKLFLSRIAHFDPWTLMIRTMEKIDSVTDKCSEIMELEFLGPCEVLPLPKKTRKLGSAFRSLYLVDDYVTKD